jgi:hypothetical protein
MSAFLQHIPGNGFVLCEANMEVSCSRSTKRSVVKDIWERATKTKGKGKSVGAACPLPSKKPTESTPTAKKPKTKTPKKTKKTKKTKSKKKGGKL